jgi:hypothetical protein
MNENLLSHVDATGQTRVMGCLPPKFDFGGLPRLFTASNPIIPRSEWREVDFSPLGVPVLDQGSHGSCVGHGSGSTYWFAYLIGGGTVPTGGFSPTSLYSQVNGGRDGGAIVSDAMDALMKTGIGLMSDVPESMIFARQISAEAKAKYNRFRVASAYHCATFDEIGSALQLGFPVSFGITIRRPFMNPPSSGIVPTGGFPVGGHCLCAYGTTKLPDGSWGIRTRNSWNESYGIKGNCILPEGHFGGSTDAFAVQCPTVDPSDPSRIPVAA